MTKIIASVILLIGTVLSAFSQNYHYEVYALKIASVGNGNAYPLSFMVLDAPENETVKVDFIFWLIKGENGRNIMVDAGFLNDVEEAKNFEVTNYVQPDSLLHKINLKSTDITDIILTHPHWDHADGISLFPNAHVWIQKEDYSYFVGDVWQKNENPANFNPRVVLKIVKLNLDGRLTLINGDDKEIIPGITVFTGGRHTYESQYVLVESGDDNIILASDNAYSYYNIDNLKSAPTNATLDTDAYVNAIKRMKELATDNKFVIPGHDNQIFSRFPVVAEGIVRIK